MIAGTDKTEQLNFRAEGLPRRASQEIEDLVESDGRHAQRPSGSRVPECPSLPCGLNIESTGLLKLVDVALHSQVTFVVDGDVAL